MRSAPRWHNHRQLLSPDVQPLRHLPAAARAVTLAAALPSAYLATAALAASVASSALATAALAASLAATSFATPLLTNGSGR